MSLCSFDVLDWNLELDVANWSHVRRDRIAGDESRLSSRCIFAATTMPAVLCIPYFQACT
jgi:hypothetical protein